MADRALPPPHTVEVAESVFAYVQPDGSWWLNNTGFVVGGDDVVAVDATSTERRTRALLDAIRAQTADRCARWSTRITTATTPTATACSPTRSSSGIAT